MAPASKGIAGGRAAQSITRHQPGQVGYRPNDHAARVPVTFASPVGQRLFEGVVARRLTASLLTDVVPAECLGPGSASKPE